MSKLMFIINFNLSDKRHKIWCETLIDHELSNSCKIIRSVIRLIIWPVNTMITITFISFDIILMSPILIINLLLIISCCMFRHTVISDKYCELNRHLLPMRSENYINFGYRSAIILRLIKFLYDNINASYHHEVLYKENKYRIFVCHQNMIISNILIFPQMIFLICLYPVCLVIDMLQYIIINFLDIFIFLILCLSVFVAPFMLILSSFQSTKLIEYKKKIAESARWWTVNQLDNHSFYGTIDNDSEYEYINGLLDKVYSDDIKPDVSFLGNILLFLGITNRVLGRVTNLTEWESYKTHILMNRGVVLMV